MRGREKRGYKMTVLPPSNWSSEGPYTRRVHGIRVRVYLFLTP
jgi:hypothetical protein